ADEKRLRRDHRGLPLDATLRLMTGPSDTWKTAQTALTQRDVEREPGVSRLPYRHLAAQDLAGATADAPSRLTSRRPHEIGEGVVEAGDDGRQVGNHVRTRERADAEAVDVAPGGEVECGSLDDRADRVDRLEGATGPPELGARARNARDDHVHRRSM